ncbi:MAG TPA: hypothetical protein VLH94_04115 [Spirochaetia bacterium]|nr:hypothetical protein [Spirochaetia bacterium]
MRTQRTLGTWKKPVDMYEFAERVEHALLNEQAAQMVHEKVMIENDRVPQYTSPTGNQKETILGRVIHARTYGPNPSWDARGLETKAYGEELEKIDADRQAELNKRWKTKEDEMAGIIDRLSSI